MEIIWLAIIPAIVGLSIGLLRFMRTRALRDKEAAELQSYIADIEGLEEKLGKLKESDQKLVALERLGAAETIGRDVISELSERLGQLEEAIEPFRERKEFASAEFHILLYEIERARKDLDSRHAHFERRTDKELSSFTSNYARWMVIMSALFSTAIGILIYFITRQSSPPTP